MTYRYTTGGITTDGSQSFLQGSVVQSTTPLTMMVDCILQSTAASQGIMSQLNTAGTTNGFWLSVNTSVQFKAQTSTGGVSTGSGGIGGRLNNRNCIIGVWRSATFRQCWLNGIADAASTASVTPASAPDNISFGALRDNNILEFPAKGTYFRAAVWNIPLEADDIQAIVRGVDFRLIHPGNLKEGWYFGDGFNYFGVNGTQTLTPSALGTLGKDPVPAAKIVPPYNFNSNIILPGMAFRRTLSRLGTRISSRQVHAG